MQDLAHLEDTRHAPEYREIFVCENCKEILDENEAVDFSPINRSGKVIGRLILCQQCYETRTRELREE